MFTDSIDANLEVIRELLGSIPPSERDRAKRAAVMIERQVTALIKDNQGHPAAGLGMSFAIFMIAQRLVQSPQSGDSDGTFRGANHSSTTDRVCSPSLGGRRPATAQGASELYQRAAT